MSLTAALHKLHKVIDQKQVIRWIPACRHLGLGVLPWSPLAGGLLGGILQKEVQSERTSAVKSQMEGLHPRLEAYEQLCREIGREPAGVALAWLLHNPGVTAPVIGPRTVEQLKGNLRAVGVKLPDEVIARLDGIWPGPGGEAPEAYAW